MLRYFIILMGFVLMLGAKDIKGASDYPLLGRIPGSTIYVYDQKGYKTLHYPTKYENYKVESKKLSGKYRKIGYLLPESVSTEAAVAIYKKKLKELGADTVWYCEDASVDLIIKLHKLQKDDIVGVAPREVYCLSAIGTIGGKQHALYIESRNKHKKNYVDLYVVESDTLDTTLEVVSAEKIAQDIDRYGHIALYGIMFEFDSDKVKPSSEATLKEITDYLGVYGDISLYVVGHTDNKGEYAYNLELSKRRANAVKKYLIQNHHINPKRLQAVGVGPVAPIASNSSEEGRKKNRRVELVKKE